MVEGGIKKSEKSAGVIYGWSLISNLGHSPQEQIFQCKKAIWKKGTLEVYLRDFPLRFSNSLKLKSLFHSFDKVIIFLEYL